MDAILAASGLRFQNLIDYPPIAVPPLQATFIRGASGSGKSTLFRLLNATESPSAGAVLYRGQDVTGLDSITLRREVLLVSQSVFLFSGTIAENFDQFYQYREQSPISDERKVYFLHTCCADFPLQAKCDTLSGGERQRVFLAIHLSLSPVVLMLDEPTSALDEVTANRLLTQVKAYCQQNQMTLLVICHDQKLVEAYADTVLSLGREESV